MPGLVLGDFNDVTASEEKFGGSQVSLNRSLRFRNMIDTCGLIDLGYEGPSFTWCNKRKGGAKIMERLDRVLANSDWRFLYPEAVVKHLPRFHSDHCPVFVQCEEEVLVDVSLRPFRFQAMWLKHPDAGELIDGDGDIVKRSDKLSNSLKIWIGIEMFLGIKGSCGEAFWACKGLCPGIDQTIWRNLLPGNGTLVRGMLSRRRRGAKPSLSLYRTTQILEEEGPIERNKTRNLMK